MSAVSISRFQSGFTSGREERSEGRVRWLVSILGMLTLAIPMSAAAASVSYPDRPIRLIVPFAPGGGADTLGRMIAAALTESLGQSVVVDNRGGAGGTIGADIVAKSAPDGYTILFGSPGPLAVNPNLQSKMPYDVVKDFAPITQLSRSPIVVVLNPGVPVTSVRELVAAAKAKPGSLNFGSAGNGSIEHMSAELFKILAGVDMTHIPYKGTGPALTDLFGGRIQMLFENLPPVLQHIKAGKLRAIAVGTKDRSAFLPDLPTVAEAGVPGYEASSWFGLLLPAKAPATVIRRLHGDAVAALRSPVFRERVSGLGAETVGSTPEQFREHMRDKIAEVAKIVKSSGMKIE